MLLKEAIEKGVGISVNMISVTVFRFGSLESMFPGKLIIQSIVSIRQIINKLQSLKT